MIIYSDNSNIAYINTYLELVFVLTNFQITILSALTSQIFIDLYTAYNFLFAISAFPNFTIIILWKQISDYFFAN